MSDDLAANAATWVPPWQRPASAHAPEAREAGGGGPEDGDDDTALPEAETDPADDLGDEGDEADGGVPEAADVDTAVEAEAAEVAQAGVAQAEVAQAEVAQAEVPEAADVVTVAEAAEVGQAEVGQAEVGQAEVGQAEGAVDAGLPRQWAGLEGAKWQDAPDAPAAEGSDVDAEPRSDVDAAGPVGEAGSAKASRGRKRAAEKAPAEGGELFGVPGQRTAEADADEDVPRRVLDESELAPALEAILMVVDEPVSELTLAGVLDVPAEQVANALIDLSAAYTRDGRGFDLRRAAGGWRFYTRADYSSYVEKFVLDGQQMRLTQASLETLAVVAYKQPVTRSRVSAIRGVNCDGVIRTLVTRGMIEECGADPDSGAHLYRTTTLFLEKLGLDSVEQLPPLAPFLPDNLDEVASGA